MFCSALPINRRQAFEMPRLAADATLRALDPSPGGEREGQNQGQAQSQKVQQRLQVVQVVRFVQFVQTWRSVATH